MKNAKIDVIRRTLTRWQIVKVKHTTQFSFEVECKYINIFYSEEGKLPKVFIANF